MRLILVAGLVALTCATSAHAKPLSRTAAQAAATVDAFHSALHRGDTVTAASLVADEALIFESGGVERTKAEYAAHHLAADAAFSKVTTWAIKRRSGGSAGDLAWIATDGRTTGTYKGRAIDSANTETMVLRRTPKGWRIVHVHWSSAR